MVFVKEVVRLFAKTIEKGETGVGCLRKGQSVQIADTKREKVD